MKSYWYTVTPIHLVRFMIAFTLQKQSCIVGTETMWLTKPKLFTIGTFKKIMPTPILSLCKMFTQGKAW